MAPENPGQTSGGDAATPPPAVAATPGGHSEVQPEGTGASSPEDASSTVAPPSVAATPGGHTDVEAIGAGASSPEDASATAVPPTVAQVAHSEVKPVQEGASAQASAGYSGAVPSLPAFTAQDPAQVADPELGQKPHATSESRTGALPEVAATPNPLSYPAKGTS